MPLAALRRSLLILASLAIPAFATAAPPARPNIVIILADDLGFSDLSAYGSEIPTPNIDAIATGGVRFRNFYNTGRCCPTRASLLTGVAPSQAGVGYMVQDFGPDHPGYRGQLTDRVVTIAEVLRDAGYFTTMTGKWHLGQPKGCVPWERGFDRVLNSPAGGFYYSDDPKGALFLDGRRLHDGSRELPHHSYTSDLFADYALRFVDEATAAKKPFFTYLAFNAPHFPLQADPADIARWRGKFMVGWDKLRADRLARQKASGLIAPDCALSPLPPGISPWADLSPAEKDHFDHIMAVYAAAITRLDRAVGDFINGLKKRGVYDDTLVIFLSDNGANAESGPEGRLKGKNPGSLGSAVFLGQSWATLGSTPFRRYKHFTHEGGIATPCLVSWPAGIPAAGRDRWVDGPGAIIDLMATAVDVAGASYPKTYHGHAILPREGVSLVPAFLGGDLARTRPLAWEHEGNRAILDGRWKLVSKLRGPWELYDLPADRSELHDLSAVHPDIAARLEKAYADWARHALVEPWRGGPRTDFGAPVDQAEKSGD